MKRSFVVSLFIFSFACIMLDQAFAQLKNAESPSLSYRYLVQYPKGFNSTAEKKYPCIIDLHGSGQRGSDLNQLKYYGSWRFIQSLENFPFIVFFPQCEENNRWEPKKVKEFVDGALKEFPIDKERIYLMGISMGGGGAWETAIEYPQTFAAIAPICGAFKDTTGVSKIKHLPVWAFHGKKDPWVPVSFTETKIDYLTQIGSSAIATIFPSAQHNIQAVYSFPELYNWFLQFPKPYLTNDVVYNLVRNEKTEYEAKEVDFKLDGNLDEWKNCEKFELKYERNNNSLPDKKDFSCTGMIGWNKSTPDKIYFAFEIDDDQYLDNFHDRFTNGSDDGLQIDFDYENNGSNIGWNFDMNGKEAFCWAAFKTPEWIVKREGNKSIVEIAIKPEEMYQPVGLDSSKEKISIFNNERIGINIFYNDADDGKLQNVIGMIPGNNGDTKEYKTVVFK